MELEARFGRVTVWGLGLGVIIVLPIALAVATINSRCDHEDCFNSVVH